MTAVGPRIPWGMGKSGSPKLKCTTSTAAHALEEPSAIRVPTRGAVPSPSQHVVDAVTERMRKQRDRDAIEPQLSLGARETTGVATHRGWRVEHAQGSAHRSAGSPERHASSLRPACEPASSSATCRGGRGVRRR